MRLRAHPAQGVRLAGVVAAALVLMGAAACAPEDATPLPASSGSSSSGSTSAAACSKDTLSLTTPGKFTVGTDKPAYEPWFSDDDPTNGKG